MKDGSMPAEDLPARVRALELELAEANETLDAIRNGEVDAVVVGGPKGQVVYTLENADRPYRVLVEQMREGAVTLGEDGTILYCNQSFAELLGQRFEQIVGHRIFDFVAEQDELRRMMVEAGPAGRSAELSLLVGSEPAPANLSIVELSVEPDADRIFCAIVTDLRQNYERARELARVEQRLAVALDAADMGSWEMVVDEEDVLRSPRHDAIFGHDGPRGPWTFEQALDHFAPEDREAVAAAFEAALTSGRVDIERKIIRANDGAVRWVQIKGRTYYRDGKPERIAGIIVDNTERRLIDEQLRQGQKMEAIGQLTGGIAHDFNNLLMIIGGSLESLSRRVVLDGRVQPLLDAARIGVARGAKLNEQLLAFARRQDMHEETVCLTDLLPTFETLLDRAVGEAVAVEVRRTPDLWSCKTDPHQLETAILNLAINARDAMDGSGALVLATANVSIAEAAEGGFEPRSGDYVRVSVTDNGCGMEPEVAARVFEPFFTTKSLGKGTGLGLSQVYGFARQSGGFVTLDSAPGQGTTVAIHLPRAEPVERRPAPNEAELPAHAQGVVLLVEDDADVRAATSAMLEELGYTVMVAGCSDEALEMLRDGRRVDILFSDVIMATGTTGIELARTIRAERPELPILLASGYTAQRVVPTAMDRDLPLLRKHYTMVQLAEALAKLID
jgi:signal transduction histidine kinase/CheY-like chemotaxis protein